jgi:hypothetical protein
MPQLSRSSKTAPTKSQTSAAASAPLDSQPLTGKNAKCLWEIDKGEDEVDEPQAKKKVLFTLLYPMSSI